VIGERLRDRYRSAHCWQRPLLGGWGLGARGWGPGTYGREVKVRDQRQKSQLRVRD